MTDLHSSPLHTTEQPSPADMSAVPSGEHQLETPWSINFTIFSAINSICYSLLTSLLLQLYKYFAQSTGAFTGE
jgi:hypothetical protein